MTPGGRKEEAGEESREESKEMVNLTWQEGKSERSGFKL